MIYRKVYSYIGTLVVKVDISLNVGDLGAQVLVVRDCVHTSFLLKGKQTIVIMLTALV